MQRLIILFILLLASAVARAAAPAVGFATAILAAADGSRPMELAVWYPARRDGTPRLLGDNAVFVGSPVSMSATPLPGAFPLVVISHGFGGNWRNQLWLADALVGQGYIVAAPNHPGTTTANRDPAQAARLWQRPGDLSRVIDYIIADPARYGTVAEGKIAAIGHSLGGWTALEIAGARFDAGEFERDCQARPQLASCRVFAQMRAGATPELERRLAESWRDRRVAAVVSLDAGLTRGLTRDSLNALHLPVLVVAAGAPSADLPAALESQTMARQLPHASTRYIEISDATHFSFMAACKPGGERLIDLETPGDGIICRDGEHARTRAAIHQQTAALIIDFLGRSLR